MVPWLDAIYEQLSGLSDRFREEVRAQGLFPLLRPVAPFNEPQFLAPIVTLAAVIGFMLLSGLAISAFATLLVALLALYLLLAEVFGFSVEFIPLRVG
jgi:hypothetical protein